MLARLVARLTVVIARLVWWTICRTDMVLSLESYTIWRDGAPYMTRMYVFGRDGEASATGWRGRVPFNVFIHCLLGSDGPEYHSHPYKRSYSLILRGSYKEWRVQGRGLAGARFLYPGDVNMIDHDTFHRIELPSGGLPTWTLFMAPRPTYTWWFFDAVTRALTKASGRKQGKRHG